jgi:hypothetical protein
MSPVKIRWTQSSVRLRITPSELATVERGEAIEESLQIGGATVWRMRLESGARTKLQSEEAMLVFSLSEEDRAQLSDETAEGVYFQDNGFRYLIEKDFPCAHPRAAEALEPQSETFTPPPGFEERKNES